MKKVNIHEAKTQLSALLSYVENRNEHIMICRAGKPVAEIIPYKKTTYPNRRVVKTAKSKW